MKQSQQPLGAPGLGGRGGSSCGVAQQLGTFAARAGPLFLVGGGRGVRLCANWGQKECSAGAAPADRKTALQLWREGPMGQARPPPPDRPCMRLPTPWRTSRDAWAPRPERYAVDGEWVGHRCIQPPVAACWAVIKPPSQLATACAARRRCRSLPDASRVRAASALVWAGGRRGPTFVPRRPKRPGNPTNEQTSTDFARATPPSCPDWPPAFSHTRLPRHNSAWRRLHTAATRCTHLCIAPGRPR